MLIASFQDNFVLVETYQCDISSAPSFDFMQCMLFVKSGISDVLNQLQVVSCVLKEEDNPTDSFVPFFSLGVRTLFAAYLRNTNRAQMSLQVAPYFPSFGF